MERTNRVNGNFQIKSNAIFATVVLLTCFFFKIQADGNDDPGIMQYISGYYCGKPGILPYIMGAPYTAILAALYSITTKIPWYGIFYLAINFGSLYVIWHSFIKRGLEIRKVIVFIGFYLAFIVYWMTNIQYTMVSALAGTASIFLLDDFSKKPTMKNSKAFQSVFCLLFFFFSYNIRFQCGIIVIAVMLYTILGKRILLKKLGKTTLIRFCGCVGVLLVSFSINRLYVLNTGWGEFESFNHERSSYMDLNTMQYDEFEDVFQYVGWDKETYDLVNSWCFMAPETDEEDFSYINDYYLELKKNTSWMSSLKKGGTTLLTNMPEVVLGMMALLAVIVLTFIRKWLEGGGYNNKWKMELLFLLGYWMIIVAGVAYLVLLGRVIDRSVMSVFVVCATAMMPYYFDYIDENSKFTKVYKLIACVVLFIVAVIGLKKTVNRTIYSYDIWTVRDEYVASHRENIYVGDGSMSYPCNLFNTFTSSTSPTNYFWWGGWLSGSPYDEQHKAYNGIESLTLTDMLQEHRYFIGNKNKRQLLQEYYEKRYENVTSTIIDENEFFIVYDFRCE